MNDLNGEYLDKKRNAKVITTFYSNIPFRLAAHLLAPLFSAVPLSSNAISFIGIALAAAGAMVLVFASPSAAIWAVPLFLAFEVAGALDGTLARARGTFSPFGSWIGIVMERVSYILMGTGLAWHVLRTTDDARLTALTLLGLVLREAIGTSGAVTLAKMPPGYDVEMYSPDYLLGRSALRGAAVKALFYTGSMYTYLVVASLLVTNEEPIIVTMVIYGALTYVAMLIKVGREIRRYPEARGD